MIQTWVADVSPLLEKETYQYYYEKLPEFRQVKADKIRFQEDKALSVGVWVLWEKMRDYYGLDDDTSFNLSHSGSLAMCAVEDSGDRSVKVGCDAEKIKEPNMEIANRFFCESEYRMIQEDESLFYRFWVLKESFMKVTRLGMKLGLNTFEIGFLNGKPFLKKKPADIAGTFYFKEYECRDLNYRMAVCSTSNEFAENIKMIDL